MADDRRELLADGWDPQQGLLMQARELGDVLAVGQQVQEPEVLDVRGDLQQARADGLQVVLQAAEDPALFVHQGAPTAGQALELEVLGRGRLDLLERIAGARHVLAELHQLQAPACVDAVGLGRCREDLFEAGELEVVDVEQPPLALTHQGVQGAGVAVVALHGHRHRPRVAALMTLDATEEVRETLRTVIDIELLEQLPVGQAHRHTMAMAAHIDAHPKFWTQDHGNPHMSDP